MELENDGVVKEKILTLEEIPDDVIRKVFDFLTSTESQKFSLLSKESSWTKISNSNYIWETIFKEKMKNVPRFKAKYDASEFTQEKFSFREIVNGTFQEIMKENELIIKKLKKNRGDGSMKIIINGQRNAGRRKLLYRLKHGEYKQNYEYKIDPFKTTMSRLEYNWCMPFETEYSSKFYLENCYVESEILIFCYDMTNKQSFEHIEKKILPEAITIFQKIYNVSKKNGKTSPILLMEMKNDLEKDRKITKNKALTLLQKLKKVNKNSRFHSISSKTENGFPEMFNIIAEIVFQQHSPNSEDEKSKKCEIQ